MNTLQLALLFGANLLFGLACIPLYIRAAKARSIIDVPNERSSHTVPTPRGGGIFIAAGCLLSIAIATVFLSVEPALGWALFFCGALVASIGFTDDLKPLPSLLRLGGHFLAAICFLAATLYFAGDPEASALAPPLLLGAVAGLVIWIVGCLNIYNFMDGIDGIATGQGLCAATAWLVIALSVGQTGNLTSFAAAALSAALLGGLLAFVCFNWSPAKVFMGDGASGFLGFSLAALPLLVADTTPADLWLKLNLGAIVLFPFLFDGTFTLVRRAIIVLKVDNGSSCDENASLNTQSAIFNMKSLARLMELTQAHRSHLYQRWVRSGASHARVATAYTGWAALCSATALLVHLKGLGLLLAYGMALSPAAVLLLLARRFEHSRR